MRKKVTPAQSPEIAVGLDIGTTKIATVIGIRNYEGKIEVHGFGKGESTGVQHGLIFNINKTVEGIKKSIEKTHERSNEEFDSVYVGVAGRHIRSMEYRHTVTRINGKNEIIEETEIATAIKDLYNISVSPGEQIISVIPQRFVIDRIRETTEPVGELGEILDGYYQIITGNENEIKKIIRCVNEADLDVKKIILEPIASGLACLSEQEKKDGVLLIDIGGGTTDIAIFLDNQPVFTRVIPVGGNIVTKDIATVCRIPEEIAEKLKTNFGTCIVEKSNSNNFITIPQLHAEKPTQISETSLAQIIYARVQNDILNEVKKAIDSSGYANRIRMGAVITGGGALLKHFKELCSYTLNMPVRIGIPEVGFISNISSELKHPIFSTALGLLKYGIENEKDNDDKSTGKSTGTNQTESPIKLNEVFKSINSFLNKILEKAD